MSVKNIYSHNSNLKDEQLSPAYIVLPLIDIIEKYHKDKIIWCPFDTELSEYVKIFKKKRFNVIYSHINEGKDFYLYQPKKWDILISNPPFSNKAVMTKRVLSFNKPFAILLPAIWINDSAPLRLWGDKDLQLLLFDKRASFKGNNDKLVPFSSIYYCWNFLPKQIMFKKLDKSLISSDNLNL